MSCPQKLAGSRRARCALLSLALMMPGCEFPVSASKYSTDEASAVLDGRAEHKARLIQAFAAAGSDCSRDFAENCSDNLESCAQIEGCTDFGECVFSQASPAAETTCADLFRVELEARWSFENLRACWAERHRSCSVEADWSCVGQYDAPSAERSELTLSQTLQYFDQPTRKADFSVRICGRLTDCSTPFSETTTDERGRYSVTLPIGTAPGRPGSAWTGYRRVTSPSLLPTRIETNIPVWGTRVDVTRVFDSTQIETLRALSGAERPEAIFIQILDCKSTPAKNVRFDLSDTLQGKVSYIDPSRSATAANGAAAAYRLAPDQELSIVARLGTDTEAELATWRGAIEPGEVVYLKMYPEPR